MNSRGPIRPGPRWFRSKLGLALTLALLGLGSTGCFQVSRDAEVLRDSLMEPVRAKWDTEIELGVGSVTLSLARAGLRFVDLDPDARAALQAVRAAEVGVYRRPAGRREPDPAAMLAAGDKAMARRGWDRLLTVVNRRELVVAYVPRSLRSTDELRLCLAVVNDRELVVVAARSDLDPLMELAHEKARAHSKLLAGAKPR